MATYLSEVNDFQRRLYLDEVAADPMRRLDLVSGAARLPSAPATTPAEDKKGSGARPSTLVGSTFGPQSIDARVRILDLIAGYLRRLAEVGAVESDSTLQVLARSSVVTVTESMRELPNRLDRLPQADVRARAFKAPTKALVDSLSVIQDRRYDRGSVPDKTLVEARLAGGAALGALLDLLILDLEERRLWLTEVAYNRVLVQQADDYNAQASSLTFGPQERKAKLAEIERTVQRFELAIEAEPAELLRQLKTLHESLRRAENVSPAQARQVVGPLVIGSVEDLESRVRRISATVSELRALRFGRSGQSQVASEP